MIKPLYNNVISLCPDNLERPLTTDTWCHSPKQYGKYTEILFL